MPVLIDLVYLILGVVLLYSLYRIFILVLKQEKQVFDKMEKKDESDK